MLSTGRCPKNMLSMRDALEALEGKWKLLILFSLSNGPKRFGELSKDVSGISDRTLSKELKSLEANQLVIRKVHDTVPQVVEYSITRHGESLGKLMDELHYWGLAHRKQIMGK